MKKVAFALAGLGSLILTSGAMGAIIGTSAVVVQTSQQGGNTTYSVEIQFSGANDVLLNTTGWNVNITGGTFFNLDPGPAGPGGDDPFGLISNGDVGQPAGIIGLPGYSQWAFDTYLTMDNQAGTQTEPGTSLTHDHIGGGAFVLPPSPSAGEDLHILVAQITCTTGAIFNGTLVAVTPSAVSGQGVDTTTLTVTNVIPGPGALALLGVAGLVSRRRRA